jgi:2-polyprenyl-3-methyl-5-hydroxy-6-metoxy-1,4-benzoquinol methylase
MSKLSGLKSAWESLAQRDALAAILTDPSKSGGKWDLTEFMATGDAEIETVLQHLEAIGLQPDPGGAVLDFGCGVGRLTQALARRFQSCVGIDISQEMITQANALNHYGHCRYVVSATPQLPFADEGFSFLYSNLVLQHVAQHFCRELPTRVHTGARSRGGAGLWVAGLFCHSGPCFLIDTHPSHSAPALAPKSVVQGI